MVSCASCAGWLARAGDRIDRRYSPGGTLTIVQAPSPATFVAATDGPINVVGPVISCIIVTVSPARGRPEELVAFPLTLEVRPGTRLKSMLEVSWPTPTLTRCAAAGIGVPGK
jgi:hypothetical protein